MKKTLLLIFVCLYCLAGSVFASSSTPPEFNVDQETPDFPVNRTVNDEINDFLAEKGYGEGNNSRSSGGDFFIAVGTGTIQAPRNNPGYLTSRNNAFEKAMLQAKKKMATFIAGEIKKDLLSEYTEGQNPLERKAKEAEAMKSPSIFDKASALVNAKLDALLEEEGVDLSKPVSEEDVQKALTSEVFESFVQKAATARIVGMQTMKVFEASPDGNKGQIGVIAVYSEKLHKMADAMFSGNVADLPSGTPKRPIREQISNDEKILLSTFGVQQKTDEKGNLQLVAFGQSSPKTDSPRSMDAAYDKAKLQAEGYLRSFAGEIAAVEEDMYSYESVQEFENGLEQYESEEYFKQKIETKAASLKISGIMNVSNWKTVHPLVNKPVVGVVVSWSPASAKMANQLGKKMATTPKKSPSNNSSGQKKYQSGSSQGGS